MISIETKKLTKTFKSEQGLVEAVNGMIVAEGTPTYLKQQIPADVITLHFNQLEQIALAKTLVGNESFIREITDEQNSIRLYVDHKEKLSANFENT